MWVSFHKQNSQHFVVVVVVVVLLPPHLKLPTKLGCRRRQQKMKSEVSMFPLVCFFSFHCYLFFSFGLFLISFWCYYFFCTIRKLIPFWENSSRADFFWFSAVSRFAIGSLNWRQNCFCFSFNLDFLSSSFFAHSHGNHHHHHYHCPRQKATEKMQIVNLGAKIGPSLPNRFCSLSPRIGELIEC